MKTNSKFLGLALTASVLFFSSCQEDATISEVEVPSADTELSGDATYTNSEYDQSMEKVALALVQSLNESDVRVAVKNEALKMFDGDYDILYENFRKTSFSDGENFQQKIAARMSGGDINGKTSATAQLDAIASNIPNLQISVPQHTETWNAEEESPWVVYVPQNFQEGVTKKLKAFDPEGVEHWIDADVVPAFPVVVVGTSERVDEEGNVRADFINEKSPINGRTAGYREYMYKINCTDISALENWALGAPELEYYVAGSSNNQAVEIENGSYYKPGKRKDIDDRWVTLDRFIFTWNRPYYGDYITVKWVEIDDVGPLAGIKVKVKVLGQEVTYDFEKAARHDDGGQKIIWQGESTSQIYDTGKMAWQMKSIQ